jgi:hypothetical protein
VPVGRYTAVQPEMSLGEWLNAPRPPLPRWVKQTVGTVLLVLVAVATTLSLTHTDPTVTMVPGTPSAVSLDGGDVVRDSTFIRRLLHDLNGNPPYPPNTVSSCFAVGFRAYKLRFQYPDGDQLTIQVNWACGNVSITAGYGPGIMSRAPQALMDDITNWPAASP